MADILNLALKKAVFESLILKTSNEIVIEKTNWWKKRLMDIDTGKFKDFKIARVSCGSADKIDLPIENIKLNGENFIIKVTLPVDEQENKEQEKEETIEVEQNTTIGDVIENLKNVLDNITGVPANYLQKETTKENKPKKEENVKQVEPKGFKEKTFELLEDFCKNKNVYTVNLKTVRIRENGQIVGEQNKYIGGVRDCEELFEFEKVDFVKLNWMTDDDFLKIITTKMKELLRGNIVFVQKARCGFSKVVSGEDMFTLKFVARKAYLFKRK